MDHLTIADPRAAQLMLAHLTGSEPSAYIHRLSRVVDEVIEALAVEVSFGRNLAEGMGRMLAGGARVDLDRYRRLVKKAAARGPTLAGLIARHLVPVLVCGDAGLADRFEETTRLMLQKGTYTLNAPLETLSKLIQEKDLACAHAFLDLLATTYSLETSYNRTVYLTHALPRAVDGFTRSRRLWQIRGLTRTIRVDERLADNYLEGLASGLHLLSEPALNQFIDRALQQYKKSPDLGARFLSLESRPALESCRELQVAVPLSVVRARLERYLHARTGLAVAIRPLSSLSGKHRTSDPGMPLVRCDGRSIYLPDEMDLMERKADNVSLFKLLVRLEAGAIEFGTYDLDVEKALNTASIAPPSDMSESRAAESDLNRFLRGFEHPIMALDLFTLCEHGRIARKVSQRYPGLYRRLTQALSDDHLQAKTGSTIGGTWFPLYRQLVMNEGPVENPALKSAGQALSERLNRATSSGNDTADTSAQLTMEFYPILAGHTAAKGMPAFLPLNLPFGRRLEPTFFWPLSHHLPPPGSGYPTALGPTGNPRLPLGHPAPYRPAKRPGLDSGYPPPDREAIIDTQRIRRHRPFLAGSRIPGMQPRPWTADKQRRRCRCLSLPGMGLVHGRLPSGPGPGTGAANQRVGPRILPADFEHLPRDGQTYPLCLRTAATRRDDHPAPVAGRRRIRLPGAAGLRP